jgi:phage terminase large subunit-like protein
VNPSCVIADEVHRWKTRKQLENWDVLSNGGFTHRQTLTIAITTAGVQSESPLAWRLHEKTRRINEGVVLNYVGTVKPAPATSKQPRANSRDRSR